MQYKSIVIVEISDMTNLKNLIDKITIFAQ